MTTKEQIKILSAHVSESRFAKMLRAVSYRTRKLTVVLEDIFQPHNAAAVLRNCDAFGLQEKTHGEFLPTLSKFSTDWKERIHVLEQKEEYTPEELLFLIGVSDMSENMLEDENAKDLFCVYEDINQEIVSLNQVAERARSKFSGYMCEEDFNEAYEQCKRISENDEDMYILMKAKLLVYRIKMLYETEKEVYGERYANMHIEQMREQLNTLKKERPDLFKEDDAQTKKE